MEDGPPVFEQDSTCPALLLAYLVSYNFFAYGAITQYSRPFQDLSAKVRTIKSWAPPGSLAATAGISVDFFSSRYLDVSVPLVRLRNLCIQLRIHLAVWVPPFRYLRIKARLPAPRSFSQAAASFFACDRQGIRHMHLVT